MNKFTRLSHTLDTHTPSYGDRDRVIIRINSAIKHGDTANSSCWIFSNNHIGTHIDVPRHFNDGGSAVNDIPIEKLFFDTVELIDIPCNSARLINEYDFKECNINADIELLFIRSGYESIRGEESYWNDNPGLAPELAGYLRKKFPHLRCVGFDFISLTSWKYRMEGQEAHKSFLCPDDGKQPILVIEDMSLKEVTYPLKRVIVSPLYVADANGTPVTVFAEFNN
jgi:kynurenine formamidase